MSDEHKPRQWVVRGTAVCRDEPGIDRICTMQVSNNSEWEDDARLIAAAPDLLEALEELASEEWRDDDDPILDKARVRARLAIKKAKAS